MKTELREVHRLEMEDALGSAIVSVESLPGGCVGEVYGLRMADGSEHVAKLDRADTGSLLDEAKMLRTLRALAVIPVPQVWVATGSLLLMQRMPGSPSGHERAERDAALHLAALHRITQTSFGWDSDTRIGGLRQPNAPDTSWRRFFRDQRLLFMADAALRDGHLPPNLHRRIENIAHRVGDFIDEPVAASMVHGDVWSGNVLVQGSRVSAWLDPAIYFADPEIELAFITLFQTFSAGFFEHYEAAGGRISPHFWKSKRHLYNLYPLLVHVRLFPGFYLSQLDEHLRRLGA